MSLDPGTFTIFPNAGGTSTWRGLSLSMAGFQGDVSGLNPIEWDTVLAETDGIRSTITYSLLGVTVPVGGAGVVPVGMGGLWRVGGNLLVHSNGNLDGQYEFVIVRNDAGVESWEANYETNISAEPVPDSFSLVRSPRVTPLDEGDVIWSLFIGPGTDATFGTPNSDFLMEYLGPTP